ncbi:MAG: class I adenylate-forming enzyme family protein [Casimicrobiaceae bacterium]
MQTVFAAQLKQHALKAPGSQAFATSRRAITYADLLGRVQSCAAWLLREGLARERRLPPDVVGITIADDVTHMVASLALLSLGVPHVCLPSRDPVAKRTDLAARLAIRRVVTTEPRHALPGKKASLLTPEHIVAAADVESLHPILADPDAPALYYASSGTTGEPKIFALSQRALAWRAESIARSERIDRARGYRSLTPVAVEDPMAKSRLVTCVYLGATSVLSDRRTSRSLSLQELCARLDVSCLELTVLQVSSLVAEGDPQPFPGTTAVYTAGSRVPVKLRQAFKARFGVPLWVHYGTREFGRISSTFPDGDGNGEPGTDDVSAETVGAPVRWIDLEIVDANGSPVAPGQLGELKVRAECMTTGYHGDPVATARHFRDGWFYPGDVVALTSDGRLCLHGRSDDMMNLNGIKIFPAEIERVLEQHPAVKAAAAFSKPSAAHGDIPVAAVELHAFATAGVDELLAHARVRLGVRAPRKIIVLDALPRNAAGKLVKRELAQLVAPAG